jgi:hypothetical protein
MLLPSRAFQPPPPTPPSRAAAISRYATLLLLIYAMLSCCDTPRARRRRDTAYYERFHHEDTAQRQRRRLLFTLKSVIVALSVAAAMIRQSRHYAAQNADASCRRHEDIIAVVARCLARFCRYVVTYERHHISASSYAAFTPLKRWRRTIFHVDMPPAFQSVILERCC